MKKEINETKLNDFLGKAVVDLGAVVHAACAVIGDRLGLYKALADFGPLTSGDLAEKTKTTERYVREWLNGQAAGGYVSYNTKDKTYFLTAEQEQCLADENSPTFLPGGFQVAVAATKAMDKIEQRFRTGEGLGWHEHDKELFLGTERFFRPGYAANLISSWIPSLAGVEAKLKNGGTVADVGCGHGSSTILLAQAYPKAQVHGFDYHAPSIEIARERAKQAGLGDRVKFSVASADQFQGHYDLVTCFDCVHDMGNPVAIARHVKSTLNEDGTWMLVEPFAHDQSEDNFNPIGRVYYCASTLICTPASLSQEGRVGLGAQAGEQRMKGVVLEGGFKHFRRTTETPFNIVYEAKVA